MKNISIIFSKRSNFNVFSAAIMWALKIPFSHVAIRMTDGDTGQIVYYQASGLSVNCVSEKQFLSDETVIDRFDIQVSDDAFSKGKTFAIDQLGKPYSFMTILGFAAQIFLSMLNIRIGNPEKANGNSWVCSQLAAGYTDVCDNIDLDISNMSPKTFYEQIQKMPKVWE
jgi:uncharacterized protein YycO